jgi:hypothetical protein
VILPLLAATLLLAACGRDTAAEVVGVAAASSAAPGITDTTVKLGSSYPFSGPASATARFPSR